MMPRITGFRWPALCVLLLLVAPVLSAQDEILGVVRGRVLGADGRPLAGVAAEVLRRSGPCELVAARAESGLDGHFRLKTGALPGALRLRLRHGGHAPMEFPLRSLIRGDGLLLPDLVLGPGRQVDLVALTPFAVPIGTLRVDVFPLGEEDRLIDLDAPPIATAVLTDGRARLQLADGLYAFVVGDGRTRLAPELMVWRVGAGTRSLPPISLDPGRTASFRIRSPIDGSYFGDLIVGSGSWHPDGGGEYRLRLRVGGRLEAAERSVLELRHLPTSAFELRLDAGHLRAICQGVPGEAEREITLREGGKVSGELRLGGTITTVAGARVFIGDRLVASDDDGRFLITGLLPGTQPVVVAKPGLVGGRRGQVVIEDWGHERRLDFDLEPGARCSGTARDQDLKPLPGVLVGADEVGDRDDGIGRYVQGVTDENGDFEIQGLPPRLTRFSVVAPRGSVALDDEFQVDANAVVVARPRLGVAAHGAGRVEDAAGGPAAGAELWFVAAPAPRAWSLGHGLVPAERGILARRVLVDEQGRYAFADLPPGSYDRIVRREGRPAELLAPVELQPGNNEAGMNWRLSDSTSARLDLPENVMLRLRSENDPGLDLWLWRAEGEGPLLLDGLPPGRYRVERLRGGVSRFATADRPYRELAADAALARFSLPALEAIAVREPEPVAFSPLRLHLLVQGDPAGGRRPELTAYSLSGAWPMKPLRLAAPVGEDSLDLELPRGVWLFHGRIPELASGWAGPITLGTGFDERGATELTLDLAGEAELIGQLVLGETETVGDEVMRASLDGPNGDLVRPWTVPVAQTGISANGTFRIEQAPSGPAVLRLDGQMMGLELELDLQPYQTLDLGEIAPSVSRQPQFLLDGRARVGASLRDRWSTREVGARSRFRLRGSYRVAIDLEGELGASPRRAWRQMIVGEQADRVDREALTGSGRAVLLGRLSVDRERLGHWPIELIPLNHDAYDFDRPGFLLETGEDGDLAARGLPEGDYALRFDYRDEAGIDYRVTLPLVLPASTAAQRPDLALASRELVVALRRERDGRALRDTVVRIMRTDLRGIESKSVFRREIAIVAEGRTDDEGEIRFSKLPLGHYDVEVSCPGLAPRRHLGVDLQVVGPSRRVELNLTEGRRLELRLVTADRRPLPGMRVFLADGRGIGIHDDRLLLTDPDGRLELADLPEVEITIAGRGPGFPAQILGKLSPVAGRRDFHELVATPGASLSVSCRLPGGRPLPGARIMLEQDAGMPLLGREAEPLDEGPSSVSAGGSRRLGLVPSGTCLIRAEKDGFKGSSKRVALRPGQDQKVVLVLEKSP
ncbi:MAG: carboxypeptidase regulatory-like domain-containing protein [Planctomycetes bacterium]|nr:carboxypeptidase regulatory-like domain-containing protein [Planctomycetota bacterium]